jgi:hypothetical protein
MPRKPGSAERTAVIHGVRVRLNLHTKVVTTRPLPTTDAAAKDAVTAWVIETLTEAGWRVPDPLKVRDSLWQD